MTVAIAEDILASHIVKVSDFEIKLHTPKNSIEYDFKIYPNEPKRNAKDPEILQ